MERAYVLINCDSGYETPIINQLKELNFVKEVHGTLGVYDIVAKVESENSESLREAIVGDIRKLLHVKSTLTLIDNESLEKNKQLAELIPEIIPEEKKPIEEKSGIGDEENEDDEDFDDDYEDDYDEDDYKLKK